MNSLCANKHKIPTLLDFPLGVGGVILPKYLKDMKNVFGMDRSKQRNQYFSLWQGHREIGTHIDNFKGVLICEISIFKRYFKVNINIFESNRKSCNAYIFMQGSQNDFECWSYEKLFKRKCD